MLERTVRGGSRQSEMPNWGGRTWLGLFPTVALLPLLPVAFLRLLNLPPSITTLLPGDTSMVPLHPSAREKQVLLAVYLTGE